MLRELPRRKRWAAVTVAVAGLFAIAAAVVVWAAARPGEAYRPGQEIEGLTAELVRSLPEDHPRVAFIDVTEETGIRFRHFGGRRSGQLPEDMGSGAAWGDYDGDGWPDLFVTNTVGPLGLSEEDVADSPARAHLYRNLGVGADGSHRGFEEVAEAAGVDFRGWGMGAAWGDYDGDGGPDLVVTAYGGNALYRNRGDGTFADVTREAGLDAAHGFWAGASWGDYDRDGDLDLYIAGYVRYDPSAVSVSSAPQYDVEVPAALNPSAFPPERNLLYRNEGDGTFTEAAEAAGVAGAAGRSLSAAWADFDEDGWPDLYVANDVSDNVLYRNLGTGPDGGHRGFEEISHRALVADYRGAMGLAVGDWDGDADTDLFITHWIAQENALFDNKLRRGFVSLSTPPPNALQFMDEADRRGLGQVALDFVGWGTSFFDYDNDGRPDLFVANGSTFQRDDAPHLLIPQRDQLFWNRGPDEGFFDVSGAAGPYFGEERVGRGAAFADYDRDGDVDALVVNHGDAAALLRNEGGNRNRSLAVSLEGRESNRSGLGARLRLLAGGRVQVREVGAQSSYLSQNDLVETFGLGSLEAADSLEIRWPSGRRQMLVDLRAGHRFHVVEGEDPRVEPLAGTGRGGVGDEARTGATTPRQGSAAGERGPLAGTAGAGPSRLRSSVDRERVLRFWETYRAANGHRLGGRLHEAATGYEAALELDPAHEDALYYLGSVRLELGDFAGAERAWGRLVDVNPRSGRAHARLGSLYGCFEENPAWDPDRAEAELLRALEINREQTGPHLQLGLVRLLAGDPRGAGGHLEAVLGSDPGSAPAHFLQGFLAWSAGDETGAREHYVAATAGGADEAAPAGASAEGDTRRGARPLVTASERCKDVEAIVDDLISEAGAMREPGESRAAMDRSYGALARLLEDARRRGGS